MYRQKTTPNYNIKVVLHSSQACSKPISQNFQSSSAKSTKIYPTLNEWLEVGPLL